MFVILIHHPLYVKHEREQKRPSDCSLKIKIKKKKGGGAKLIELLITCEIMCSYVERSELAAACDTRQRNTVLSSKFSGAPVTDRLADRAQLLHFSAATLSLRCSNFLSALCQVLIERVDVD